MDNAVDLDHLVDACHKDGRVVRAVVTNMGCVVWKSGSMQYCAFPVDGFIDREQGEWTLRNILTAKPSTPSNEELTQRMEKLVERVAADDIPVDEWLAIKREARQLVLLRKPEPGEAIIADMRAAGFAVAKEDEPFMLEAAARGYELGHLEASATAAKDASLLDRLTPFQAAQVNDWLR